jgi:hypothetical protein
MECAICLGTVESRNFKTLTCNHCFHKECIDIWLKDHSTCPYCRSLVKFILVKIKRRKYKTYLNPTNIVFERKNKIIKIEYLCIKSLKVKGKKFIITKRDNDNALSEFIFYSKEVYHIFNLIKQNIFNYSLHNTQL